MKQLVVFIAMIMILSGCSLPKREYRVTWAGKEWITNKEPRWNHIGAATFKDTTGKRITVSGSFKIERLTK
jgi:uncharacterized protein YceK